MKQIIHPADQNGLLPVRQSSNRRFHSTESAVLVAHNNIIRAIDDGYVAAIALLDLSPAFDSVDHHFTVNPTIQVLRHGAATRVLPFITNWSYAVFITHSGQNHPIPLTSCVPQSPAQFIS